MPMESALYIVFVVTCLTVFGAVLAYANWTTASKS